MNQQNMLRGMLALITAGCLYGGIQTYDPSSTSAITVAANGSPKDEDYVGARAFKAHLEAVSEGEIGVEIYASGEFCGSARECIEFLRAGILDVFMTTGGGVESIYGAAQIIDLPYAMPDDATAECVLDGPLKDQLRDGVLAAGGGLRLMAIGNTGGWRSIATSGRDVISPADMAGLKIRSTPSQMQQVFIRALGASPTPISWSETYVSLATGLVDGTTNSVSDIVFANLHEEIDRLTIDAHSYMGAMWWVSERQWQNLDAEQQAQVASAFEVLKQTTRDKGRANQAEATELFLASGGEIRMLSPEERSAFVAAATEMRQWFAERYGAEWIERLDEAVAACTDA